MSSQYEYDPDRVAGSGEIVEGTAGATINDRGVCYLGADGNYYPADSDVATTMPALVLALGSVTMGRNGEFLVKGFVGLSTWAWTAGSELYVSGTAGQMSHVVGTVIQQIGIATSATQIWFDPHIASGSGLGDITIRVNTGVDVGTRPRLNLINGLKMAIAAVDDAVGNEVDITFTVNETSGEPIFFRAQNPDGNTGTHAGESMPQSIDTLCRIEFLLPTDFNIATWSVDAIVIPDGGGTMRYGVTTNFGLICANEGKAANTDSIAQTDLAVTQDEIECISMTGALAGSTPSDLVGLEFTRYGSHGNDNITATIWFIGVVIRRP